jgi:hypothetical protein
LHVQRACAARRAIAAITGLWLVAFGVLGARHEASVAHYTDARTGEVFHAAASGCADRSADAPTHAHAADSSADHDGCALAAVLHQAIRPDVAVPALAHALEPVVADRRTERLAALPRALYRLAPKTSPPSRS